MPLDGLRAWIGEVERKLGVRTRVFLALAVIAVGGAGAAIVLAVDAQNSSVRDSDVRALQEQLEARITEGGTAQLETEVKALQEQVKALQEGGGSAKAKSGSSGGASSGGTTEGGSSGGAGAEATTPNSKNLQELLRKAKEQQK